MGNVCGERVEVRRDKASHPQPLDCSYTYTPQDLKTSTGKLCQYVNNDISLSIYEGVCNDDHTYDMKIIEFYAADSSVGLP